MSDNEKNAASIEEKVEVERSAPSPSYTEDEERALVRKLDWRIMPIACIMYLFACELCVLFDGIFIQYPDTPYLSPCPRTWQ